MNEKNKRVVIKVDLPKKIKLQFKVFCTHKQLTMSYIIEELINKWIQADCYTDNFVLEPSEENNQELKGYIFEPLKIEFKILCVQKGITMRSAIYNLINQWIEKIN